MTWGTDIEPPHHVLRWRDWPRILGRGGLLVVVIFGGLGVLLLLRPPERLVFGIRRPVTPGFVQAVCKLALAILRLRVDVSGRAMTARGALVVNHASWLDIFVLNSASSVFFVSKAEVARWPGIGWLARATGTVFVRRDRREAALQKLIFEARLRSGHRLLFFPEGTSTDGQRVLPFKSTLFEAFFAPELQDFLYIQPVALRYHAPKGRDKRFYGWWGHMTFGGHLLQVLAQAPQGHVTLEFLDPLAVVDIPDRKALSTACEQQIRKAFDAAARPGLPHTP